MDSHWPPLSQWWRNLGNRSLCPVLCLVSRWAAPGCTGSIKDLGKDWSGSVSLILALALTLPSHYRASSPSLKTPVKTCCTCRWRAWKLKTRLFITVHWSHTDTKRLQTRIKTWSSSSSVGQMWQSCKHLSFSGEQNPRDSCCDLHFWLEVFGDCIYHCLFLCLVIMVVSMGEIGKFFICNCNFWKWLDWLSVLIASGRLKLLLKSIAFWLSKRSFIVNSFWLVQDRYIIESL